MKMIRIQVEVRPSITFGPIDIPEKWVQDMREEGHEELDAIQMAGKEFIENCIAYIQDHFQHMMRDPYDDISHPYVPGDNPIPFRCDTGFINMDYGNDIDLVEIGEVDVD